MVAVGNVAGFWLKLIVVSSILHHVRGSATVAIKLLLFFSDGRTADGKVCDWSPGKECDPYFVICAKSDSMSTTCDIGQTTTRTYTNENTINNFYQFTSLNYTVVQWKGAANLEIAVYDSDGIGSHPLMDRMRDQFEDNSPRRVDQKPSPQSKRLWGLNRPSQTWLDVGFSVWCNTNYYGVDCTLLCAPKNNSEGHYSCSNVGTKVCLPGWREVDGSCLTRDECHFKPCQNGGTCTNVDQGYICTCPSQYKGKDCTIERRVCERTPCQNGGTCQDGSVPSEFTCYCTPGFIGTQCEQRNLCYPNPCSNNGSCQQILGEDFFTCKCPDSYYGRQCDNFDFCTLNPCQNNGTCVRMDNMEHAPKRNYTCECTSEFQGKDCEEEIEITTAETDTIPKVTTFKISTLTTLENIKTTTTETETVSKATTAETESISSESTIAPTTMMTSETTTAPITSTTYDHTTAIFKIFTSTETSSLGLTTRMTTSASTSDPLPVHQLALKNKLTQTELKNLPGIISEILMKIFGRTKRISVYVETNEIQIYYGNIVTLVNATATIDNQVFSPVEVNRLLFSRGIDWLSSQMPKPVYVGSLRQITLTNHKKNSSLIMDFLPYIIAAVLFGALMITLVILLRPVIRRRHSRLSKLSCAPLTPGIELERSMSSPGSEPGPYDNPSFYMDMQDGNARNVSPTSGVAPGHKGHAKHYVRPESPAESIYDELEDAPTAHDNDVYDDIDNPQGVNIYATQTYSSC